jgi:gliding motility-associated lipoprotein GldH
MKSKLSIVFALVLLSFSCDKQRVYEQFVTIEGKSWDNSDVIKFNVNIEDTVTLQNVYLAIRNTGQYEYSNLYVFVTAVSPNGVQSRDTTEITLADPRGKWLGKGSASVYTLYYPFREHIRFPLRGIYQFRIEQAMWIKDLKHISDVGLRIEKVSKKK